MIDAWFAQLRNPRDGAVMLTGFVALLMASHWKPMVVPSLLFIGVAILRPRLATHPLSWWAMAALWTAAIAFAPARMEDHVYLFVAWLAAMAVSLQRQSEDAFVRNAAWQARMLIGVTFAAAVGWKLAFNDFASGTALWLYMIADHRFGPLVTAVGLAEADLARDRLALTDLLAGTRSTLVLNAPSGVLLRVVLVAALALTIEALIAISYLASDKSRLSRLRLPSLVAFGVLTYAVVPVVAFAALLAVLALTAAHWHPDALWVFPALILVSGLRLAFLTAL